MKKSIFIKLSIVFLAISFIIPRVSTAQSMSDLQAEITALLAQVQSLQQQLAETSSGSWCHEFSGNLFIGQSGSEVSTLQTALQKDGETINITGSFDDQTASAVTGFQEKYASDILTPNGLSHGTGYVGPSTRAKLNALFGCGSSNPPIIYNPISTSTPASSSLPIRICPAWGCGTPPARPIAAPTSTMQPLSTSTISVSVNPLLLTITTATNTPENSGSFVITPAPLGGNSHIKSSTDNLGMITFSGSDTGLLTLNSLKITFSGSALVAASSSVANFLNSIQLIDQNGTSVTNADGANAVISGDTATWVFQSGFELSQGSYQFIVRGDTTQLSGTPGVSESLNINIQNTNDIQYTDSAGTTDLGLPASMVPLTINSITYPLGE